MAYKDITDPNDKLKFYAADEDADVTTIEAEHPDDPVGSVILADNAGSPKVHFKFPAGSYSPLN